MSGAMHNNGGGVPRYDVRQTYDWNYERALDRKHFPAAAPIAGDWRYAGLRAASPLGIAAGPLLNGKWILHYAALGFDILTYKTVRSRERACYPLPNLQPVAAVSVDGTAQEVVASEVMTGSWAVSFGMPSRAPEIWRADVAATRRALPKEKLLSVSVVATPEPGWSLAQLAADYALCARWAVESGADCVEANFSCPNVSSRDGQLYQQPDASGKVAETIRREIGPKPLLIKIGHVTEEGLARKLVAALSPHVQALVMVNCISAVVAGAKKEKFFGGERRGIAGAAIREAAIRQVVLFHKAVAASGSALTLTGVGGIGNAADVKAFLKAGCAAVQLATAAMLEPELGRRLKEEMGVEGAS